jgi:iron complex outermembrane receptor protein
LALKGIANNMKFQRGIASVVAVLGCAPIASHAQQQLAQLAEFSLEQLSEIKVTSASRREERLDEVAAAIYVVSAEDIRRSGATTIGEALRLAPNLQVMRGDSNQYIISARGHNVGTANKMLVIVDGRTIYTPLFSGVFWDAQYLVLEDIERIEVISGPAATLWGSNGVNGVINITTFSARQTQGAHVSAVAGNFQRGGLVRYGGKLGADANFRVYARYFDRDERELASGASAKDASQRGVAGFRMDWERAGRSSTVQADVYQGDIGNLGGDRDVSGGNILARWQHRIDDTSSMRLQAYYDRTERQHVGTFGEKLDIFDVDFQHVWAPRADHTLVWGAGYRHARDDITNSASLAFLPAQKSLNWGNVFVQDEVALAPHLNLTLGLKAEGNPYTGHEWLPNVRLAWQPVANNLIWGALSRAVRAPSRLDRDLYVPGQPPFVISGNDTFMSEIANVAEIGYRAQVSNLASFSLTAFLHGYPNLRSVEPGTPSATLGNGLKGRTHGLEGWGSWRVLPAWRLAGGFVLLRERFERKEGSRDVGGPSQLANDPRQTAQVRSSWDVGPALEFDVAARYMGKLPDPAVPAYTVLDARLGWRVTRNLELSFVVQNALDREHAESGTAATRAEFGRTYYVKAQWKL